MNICIGGDLDGQVVILNKMRFNAKEIDQNKSSSYIKQKYVKGDQVFNFDAIFFCQGPPKIGFLVMVQPNSKNAIKICTGNA